MNVLYNHQIFHLNYGGIARYHVELAKNLNFYKKKSINLSINSPFYKNNHLNDSKNILNFNGLRLPHFKGSGRLCLLMNNLISPHMVKKYNPDIIHETYYNSINESFKNTKKIITVHDMTHELFPNQFPKKDQTPKLKKLAINKADHIICVSKTTQKDLIKILNVDVNKTSVVYHGLNVKTEKIEIFKKKLKPYLLYVGSRIGYKNFSRFLKAYSSPKIKKYFNLVVFGGHKFSHEEVSLINKLQISEKNIKYVDGNDTILANYYKNAFLFVYPSLYEGFGFPPLEAMSYGCPVICSNTGSIPEIVGHAASLFDPSSIDSIRDALMQVLYDEDLRRSLTIKGFDVAKKFSWKNCALETFKVYKSVL